MSVKLKIILSFFSCFLSHSLSEETSGVYFTKFENHQLEGNVIEKVKSTDVLDCCLRCKRLTECSSINFAYKPENGFHGCVLMNRDVSKVTPSKVYHHFARLVDNCTDIVCENGGTCRKSTSNGVRCHCLQGFTGKRCETKYNWWLKINSNPVCFGTKNSSYGHFHIKQNGTVTTIQLKHLSGLMTCNKESLQTKRSNWGCGENVLYTILTDSQDRRILPQDEFIIYFPWLQYLLPGVNRNSTELTFKSFSTPMNVTAGQEYRIWFGQDLTNTTEKNNDGSSCVDVYMNGWFR
ncbi:uncharacterized protein LOC116299171 [Actinia tenebrosa]|uniref:Uncharacterized protein LOC116299171 n=1 Tax=Actinia tenebrosa TaxID=6105 RepID=A0A6P8IDP5_ACTTE|nr:uncharacterized protein LOC116299171 [Actinia tenebrosa]